MRPTFAIIVFTVLSGAGYGLLFVLGVGLMLAPAWSRTGIASLLGVGAALCTSGLLASVAHLGRPLRAWRAFSQWRSSWLSREGVMAVLSFLPIAAIAALLLSAPSAEGASPSLRVCGALLALASVATVYCTANIYSSLAPIRAWHNAWVPPVYLALGLYSGCLGFVAVAFANHASGTAFVTLANLLVIAPACAGMKWRYWRGIDGDEGRPSAGAATGLDRLGNVASVEQPHTEQNYLTHEMGFVLARKHSRRLRGVVLVLLIAAPLLTALCMAWLPTTAAGFSVLAGFGAVIVERWLFFAEAKHAVMAYYGRS